MKQDVEIYTRGTKHCRKRKRERGERERERERLKCGGMEEKIEDIKIKNRVVVFLAEEQ